MSENKNMELWDKVCKTDPKLTKNFKGKGGFQGTAVCAQAQRKKATELFGSFGTGWGVQNEVFEIVQLGDDSHSNRLFYSAELNYTYDGNQGRFPISAEIDVWIYVSSSKYWKCNNDIRKKVRTDAMTKGLSELGFNSDIFEGKFDDNKYIQEMNNEFSGNPPPKKQQNNSFNKQEKIDKIESLMDDKGITMGDREGIRAEYKKATTYNEMKAIFNKVGAM